MLKELERQFLIKLKTILLFKKFLFFLLFLLLLYLSIYNYLISHKSKLNEKQSYLIGKIIAKKMEDEKLRITIKTPEKVIATYYYQSDFDKKIINEKIKLGTKVKLIGKLEKPEKNTIPNTFNYQKYLYYQHIYYLMNINDIKVIAKNHNIYYTFKNYLINKIERKKDKEYYYSFILGDKSYINKDIQNTFKQNGITHLFALSGMHIALFISVLNKIFHKLKFKNIIIYLFLGFYLFLTNFAPSILRAIFFYILLRFNKKLEINLPTLIVLLYTVILLLFLNPFLLFNIGFLYSIMATFGLILSAKLIKKNNYLLKILMTSLIATIFTLPITLNNFYEINLLGIIFNIIFVPLISFIIYPLILISFFMPTSFLLSFFIKLLELLSTWMVHLNLTLSMPKVSIIVIVSYYILLIIIILYRKYFLIFLILGEGFFFKITPFLDSNYYLYFLDVSQGDSLIIKIPFSNKVMMIDTGGKIPYSEGQEKYYITDNTMTFLKSMGINKIDSLILTHGDYDHMGDALHLVNNFKIEKVIFNNDAFNELEKDLIVNLKKENIKYYNKIKNINIKNFKLYFLNTKIYDNENDNSNVTYTNILGYKFLFMGDASTTKEQDILNKYNLSNITFLKVGHHGSKTSTSKEFVSKITPKYAIISVGKNNRYGHPNKEVLDNLKNTKIYRTDLDGTIIVKIKNKKLTVKTTLE